MMKKNINGLSPVVGAALLFVVLAPIDIMAESTERSAPASIISLKDAVISAEVAANINNISVDVGDQVNRGQLLARLDCREFDIRYEQAQADVAANNARLMTARAKVGTAESERVSVKRNVPLLKAKARANHAELNSARSTLKMVKARAEADIAECHLTNLELQRAKSLRQEDLVSQRELDQALANLQRAEAECKAVVSEVENAQSIIQTAKANLHAADRAIDVQEAKVAVAKSKVETSRTEIKSIQAQLDAARSKMNIEKLMASRCNLLAPFDGQITKRMVQVGQRIGIGEEAFQLISMQDTEVVSSLSQDEIISLKKANTIIFKSSGVKEPVAIRAALSLVTGEARTQEARFTFKRKNQLPTGMTGRIVWQEGEK